MARVVSGEAVGTYFRPRRPRLEGRKRWLVFAEPAGQVAVNPGAQASVVEKGKSLLPVGVMGVEGDFRRGEVVSLVGEDGVEFARGICEYDADMLDRVKGLRAGERMARFGPSKDEVVHRDNLLTEA